MIEGLRETLEDLYARYNRREFVHPDPLEFLYAYPDLRDREVAGLVAATWRSAAWPTSCGASGACWAG